jgi:hypothetical protein
VNKELLLYRIRKSQIADYRHTDRNRTALRQSDKHTQMH